MTTDEILAKATPRPWRIAESMNGAFNLYGSGHDSHTPIRITHNKHKSSDEIANMELTNLAVNSYEKQRECIAELAKGMNVANELFGALEDSIDKQIYPEQVKDDFDAPDDRLYELSISAVEWRRFGNAMQTIQSALARAKELL